MKSCYAVKFVTRPCTEKNQTCKNAFMCGIYFVKIILIH